MNIIKTSHLKLHFNSLNSSIFLEDLWLSDRLFLPFSNYFYSKMLHEWTNFVASFNGKWKQMLAENILSFFYRKKHCHLQNHCLGHQLGKVITSINSIICVPIGPYDHYKASLSVSPTTYVMSVHSFIQLILGDLPQEDWQSDNAFYWTSKWKHHVTISLHQYVPWRNHIKALSWC